MPGISLQSLIILSEAGTGDFSDQNKQIWHGGLVQKEGGVHVEISSDI